MKLFLSFIGLLTPPSLLYTYPGQTKGLTGCGVGGQRIQIDFSRGGVELGWPMASLEVVLPSVALVVLVDKT